MERRGFLRACAASAALAAGPIEAAANLEARFYARALLVDTQKRPLAAGSLVAGRNYIFHYPFEGTPCFLLNLGRPTHRNVSLRLEDGRPYEWPGGVGPHQSLVAYSAICTHRLSYPTPQISFISFREHSTASRVAHPNTIHCCSEHSEYDPAAGARVVNGPAPQPLSAVLLEYEAAVDRLYAVGTLGGELYNAFFEKFALRLELDYGSGRARARTGAQAVVMELASFCKQQVRC